MTNFKLQTEIFDRLGLSSAVDTQLDRITEGERLIEFWFGRGDFDGGRLCRKAVEEAKSILAKLEKEIPLKDDYST